MAQHVALALQARRIAVDGETSRPHLAANSAPVVAAAGPRAERLDVRGSAGLRAAPDRRVLPAAERLAPHDGTGDVPVDVGVADLDAVAASGRPRARPATGCHRSGRARWRSGCRSRDRGRRHGSGRAPGRSTRCDGTTSRAARPVRTPGCPQVRGGVEAARLDQPLLARRPTSSAPAAAPAMAAPISGPIIVARSSARPTRTLRTASASRRRNGGRRTRTPR